MRGQIITDLDENIIVFPFQAYQGDWYVPCFSSQQVTENDFKAYLYSQGEEIVIAHSVSRFCTEAAEYWPEFSDKTNRWSILDGYYVPTNYQLGTALANEILIMYSHTKREIWTTKERAAQ